MKKRAADTYVDSKLDVFDEKGHANIITYARNQKKNFSTTSNGTEFVIPFKEASLKEGQNIGLLVPEVQVGQAQRDTTELMKQVLETRRILKEKFGRNDFGKLVLSKATTDKTKKDEVGLGSAKGAFARLAAALQEIRRLQTLQYNMD